jgi:hypothetical protein
MISEALARVHLSTYSGIKPDIAQGRKSANSRYAPARATRLPANGTVG